MKNFKRIAMVLFSAILCLGSFSTLAGCGKKLGSNGFEWWLASRPNTDYYSENYKDNPAVNYIENYKKFTNSSGEQQNIEFKFTSSPTGAEENNFNTMIGSGDYPDIMDLSVYRGSPVDLYKGGVAMDITDYVENNMPNYMKFLNDNPDYKKYAYQNVDGKQRIVKLSNFNSEISYENVYCGYMYRRDWIIKYGTMPATIFDYGTDADKKLESLKTNNGTAVTIANPYAGTKLVGGYSLTTNRAEVTSETAGAKEINIFGKNMWLVPTYDASVVHGDSWVDNVIFPSGNKDPIFISDWEWMLDYFKTAVDDLNKKSIINGGYAMNLPYQGVASAGDIASSFGGGGQSWYIEDVKDANGNIKQTARFGATSEDFKTYLKCMSGWYYNGWIDKGFASRSSDMFFKIDTDSIWGGKVGLFFGPTSALDTRLYNSNIKGTDGVVVYGASQPINDTYGGDAQKFKIPYTFYQQSLEGTSIMITNKAKDKDLTLLFNFLDYMFTTEGTLLKAVGLNEEQVKLTNDKMYKDNGIEWAYKTEFNADGTINKDTFVRNDVLTRDVGGITAPAAGAKLWGLSLITPMDRTPTNKNSMMQFARYTNTGFMSPVYTSLMTEAETTVYSKTFRDVDTEFLSRYIAEIVKLDSKSKYGLTNAKWAKFVEDVNAKNPEKLTKIYQDILDRVE